MSRLPLTCPLPAENPARRGNADIEYARDEYILTPRAEVETIPSPDGF
jgi:hypothetical protein